MRLPKSITLSASVLKFVHEIYFATASTRDVLALPLHNAAPEKAKLNKISTKWQIIQFI